ncbi:hypothetical protein ACLKA7_002788 [Drosophila subpalustris]
MSPAKKRVQSPWAAERVATAAAPPSTAHRTTAPSKLNDKLKVTHIATQDNGNPNQKYSNGHESDPHGE